LRKNAPYTTTTPAIEIQVATKISKFLRLKPVLLPKVEKIASNFCKDANKKIQNRDGGNRNTDKFRYFLPKGARCCKQECGKQLATIS
jgi:hypothetical protein